MERGVSITGKEKKEIEEIQEYQIPEGKMRG